MQSLTFVLESTLLAPLVEFVVSPSGHVEPRQGLALGWLGSVVAGLAVVFGTADRAQADDCFGIPEGSSRYIPTDDPCRWRNHKPTAYWHEFYTHSPGDKSRGCVYKGDVCL